MPLIGNSLRLSLNSVISKFSDSMILRDQNLPCDALLELHVIPFNLIRTTPHSADRGVCQCPVPYDRNTNICAGVSGSRFREAETQLSKGHNRMRVTFGKLLSRRCAGADRLHRNNPPRSLSMPLTRSSNPRFFLSSSLISFSSCFISMSST